MNAFTCCFILLVLHATSALGQQQDTQPAPPAKAPAKSNPDNATEQDMLDSSVSVALYYWLGPIHPSVRTGRASTGAYPSDLDYPGKNTGTPAVVVSIPAGSHNAVRVSYFRTQGQGNTTANGNLTLFGTTYAPGDYLSVAYTLQNLKASWDFLTWPFPMSRSTWRIKTLWEAQYTTLKSSVDAPLKTDAAGHLVSAGAKKSDSFFYPSFGVGAEKLLSKNLRFEAKASGFAVPHYSTIWDADARVAYRRGHFEVFAGGKAFHFKTSPKRSEYVRGTLDGAFVGLCWYLNY